MNSSPYLNKRVLSLLCVLILEGCASSPPSPQYLPGEGKPPASLDDLARIEKIPNAIPKDEPLHPFANLPYTEMGQNYTPLLCAKGYKERGLASWSGIGFEGKMTASGELSDLYAMTAAHNILPIPSYVRVTHLGNGKSIVVRVNDRGPFHTDRIINLSYVAAKKLDMIESGTAEVEIEAVMPEPISY